MVAGYRTGQEGEPRYGTRAANCRGDLEDVLCFGSVCLLVILVRTLFRQLLYGFFNVGLEELGFEAEYPRSTFLCGTVGNNVRLLKLFSGAF